LRAATFGRIGARQQAAGLGGGVSFLAKAGMALDCGCAGLGGENDPNGVILRRGKSQQGKKLSVLDTLPQVQSRKSDRHE
jgi:hypothetical protein